LANQSPSPFIRASEAASLLGVKRATLYAYASRGLVRSIPSPGGRSHLYRRDDLERLRARRDARAGHAAVAASALRFGEPVLDSSITRLTPAGPVYRGRGAVELAAAGVPLASVAELLWTGELPEVPPLWQADGFGAPVDALRALLPAQSHPLSALAVAVPAIGARDAGRFDYNRETLLPRARALILRMAAALALPDRAERVDAALAARSVARAVAVALGARGGAEAVRAIREALILIADHELNASAFAARVAASAGGDLYDCIAAALATLSGPRHGRACDRVEALLSEVERPERAARVVYERSRRGDAIPGFGHSVYPRGDPRAAPLLERASRLAPQSPGVRTALALVEAMREAGRAAATVDLGLIALTHALGMSAGAAVGIRAVGRAAGWVAHCLEQYEAGFLMRPRARYLDVD
jgi:citrate synthase